MMNTLNVPQADMQERVLLQSPMPNPMIIMLHSPHMCGQTTAATQKQFGNTDGLSDRKTFAVYEQQDSRSPNAVRNFMYPEAVQKHFQSNQDELMNSFEKSPEMMGSNDFSALHAEGQQLHFSAQKDQTDFKQPMEQHPIAKVTIDPRMLVKAGRNQQPLLYQESHSYEKKHSLFKG